MINERPGITIACPLCQTALSLPEATPPAADLQCPLCKAEFAVSAASRPELPVARVVTRPAPPAPGYLDLPLADLSASGVHIYERGPSNANHAAQALPQTPARTNTSFEQPKPPRSSRQSLDHFDDVDAELDFETPSPATAGVTPDEVDSHAATVAISPGKTVRLSEQLAAAVAREAAPSSATATAEAVDPMNFAAEPHGDEDDIDDEPTAATFASEFTMKAAPRRRRRKSGVVGLVGIVGGGVIGLLLGGYVLLWIRGEAGDILQMSRWLPPSLLPPSMQQATASDAGKKPSGIREAALASSESDAVGGREARVEQLTATAPADLHVDSAVTPATAVEPLPTASSTGNASVTAPPAVKWPVTPLIADLSAAKMYSLGELGGAVATGELAAKTFLAGDLSKRDSVRVTGGAYVQLCALAERFTLADPADYGAELFTQLALAKAALRSATVDDRRHDLAVVATRWVQHDRRPNQGVILVGTVRDLRTLGPWTECRVEIAVGDQTVDVPVVMDRLEFNVGREVGVVGVIVANPQQHMQGYQGDATQIILAGDAFNPAVVVVEAGASVDFLLPGE